MISTCVACAFFVISKAKEVNFSISVYSMQTLHQSAAVLNLAMLELLLIEEVFGNLLAFHDGSVSNLSTYCVYLNVCVCVRRVEV